MDWSKVDAGLARALDEGDAADRYVVFVHLEAGADPGPLTQLDVVAPGDARVRTATLSAAQVAQLTDRAEVRAVRLSLVLGLRRPT